LLFYYLNVLGRELRIFGGEEFFRKLFLSQCSELIYPHTIWVGGVLVVPGDFCKIALENDFAVELIGLV
jgi:hypothetical protein